MMKSELVALAVISLFELFIWLPFIWRVRNVLAVLVAPLLLGVSGLLLIVHPRVWTATIFFLTCYRIFNLARLIRGRMHERYLRSVTFRTSLWLISLQIATLLLLELFGSMLVASDIRWEVLAGLQLLLVLVLTMSTLRHIRTTRAPIVEKSYPDRDLPTLTVAIPARNETDDLQTCLALLLQNDYPKLEILVLDDCSANRRTPEIIRSFAHDGVRFVEGSEADQTWLAKNWAYEKLAEEANGELILFCGVDTRFGPSGLRTLVTTLLNKNKSMISVLPRNQTADWLSLLVQPVRYGWELCLPRRIFQRPPVLSTCWLIKKSFLVSAGGFKAVSRSIVPESYFARACLVHDGYSFMRSREVISQKPLQQQIATAVRTRYPQLRRRPELVSLLTLIEVGGLLAPFGLLVAGILLHMPVTIALATSSCMLLCILYILVVNVTYGHFNIFSPLLLPAVLLTDVVLMHYSMFKYEFSEVVWKGRNICIPVMHVVPHLPKLSE